MARIVSRVGLVGGANSARTTFRQLHVAAEHFVMVALIYWLLLDPLQSAYPLDDSVVMAMVAIGTMAIGIWLGTAGKGWRPPKLVRRTAEFSFSDSSLFLAVWVTFLLGMFHFALSGGFDLSVMIDGLGMGRWAAPWSRGSIGDWHAFTEHMTYFGYVLPSLTVVLANRRGWLQPRVFISATVSLTMVLLLAQGGGRRIVGVVVGAAVLNCVLLQQRLKLKLVIGFVAAVAVLLVGMEEMLQDWAVGFSAALGGKADGSAFTRLHVEHCFLLEYGLRSCGFHGYRPTMVGRLIAFRHETGQAWAFWGERPVYHFRGWLGCLHRAWALRQLRQSRAPV